MLEISLIDQLRQVLVNVREPVDLVATLGEDDASRRMGEALTAIAELHPMLSLLNDGDAPRVPSFTVRRASNHAAAATFAGLPLGHEFTSLVLALLWAGGHPPRVEAAALDRARGLTGPLDFELFYSLTCHNCPDVVQAVVLMAMVNPAVTATLIEGSAFQDEVEARDVMAVPATFLNGESFYNGKLGLDDILDRLDSGATADAAAAISARDPYDVLIIGGGPAGAAAAIYAARKGFRTGMAAERFGGQLGDTLGIENFISVPYTEGPKMVAALESHVGDYAIDVMPRLTAEALTPAGDDGLHRIDFAGGARLGARSLILATGARWRELGVPGEAEYRGKGVAYCPHCDGPLFKGKRVAVVGGGNSGVEAAIDLANIVGHVTLIEYDRLLRADAVLQDKLRSMANVTIITHAATGRITGDGARVDGLVYNDRASGAEHVVALEGVFIQIGLVPNTEWLKGGAVEMNRYGEIIVDARGGTNVAGLFAAGDCTTVPYKQIIVAMGEGTKAALSAFDHIIRSAAVPAVQASA